MSRPKKATVEYFPHYVNHGKTMFALESKYGNDGYAFWFKILEVLGATEQHYIDCNDIATFQYIIAKTKTDEEKATEIIEYLVCLGCIDKELWSFKIIWSDHFVTNMDELYSRRTVKCYTKSELMGVIATLYPLSGIKCNNQPQSKVEESKVEEKEEERNDARPIKQNYADNVRMTVEQYDKLVEQYGKHRADNMIIDLSLWKSSKGKKTKCDYSTVMAWMRKEDKEKPASKFQILQMPKGEAQCN